jgi:hypothetical protein
MTPPRVPPPMFTRKEKNRARAMVITGRVTSRTTWFFIASQILSSPSAFVKLSRPTKSKFGDRPLQLVVDT